MSTSSEELGLVDAIEKAVQAEVERRMKPGKKRARTRAMEQVMKPWKKRAKKRAMEQVTEQVMERVTEQMRVMERELKRVIKRKMKCKCKVVKVPEGAPTDRNVNARTSEVKEYRLLFVNKLHNIIYTKDKIRDDDDDDDDGSVKIKLIDANSGEIEKVGRLSSIEIEIIVLRGDFGFEGQENWTKKQFKAKTVHQRGDKPLLKGKQSITLRDGVGSIDDLSFSVNSSWIKCKKFRLGARVLQSSSNMGQVRIREAITEAFTVRYQRGKMKHLEKIKKDGKFHKVLIDADIRSGSDLKQMYKKDPAKLRRILDGVGCSKWEWEVIVHHGPRFLDDANSNPSRSQEAEANNTATTGSTKMPDDSIRASSSQYPAENFQNSDSQLPEMSIPHSHPNAQLIDSNDSHQPLTASYSSNDNLRTESFQINNNEAVAYNTAATGGPPFRRLQSIQQGATGMPDDSIRASSSQYPAVNFQNSASQPSDMSVPHSHANAQPLNNDWYPPLFNDPLLPSNANLWIESFQINNNGLDAHFSTAHDQQNIDGVHFDTA